MIRTEPDPYFRYWVIKLKQPTEKQKYTGTNIAKKYLMVDLYHYNIPPQMSPGQP